MSPRRSPSSTSTSSAAAMGSAQGKSSKGTPARSDGLGIERPMRNSRYVPSRLSDPLPTAPAAKEALARRAAPGDTVGRESDKDGNRTEATTDDKAKATVQQPQPQPQPQPPPPPPPPRREDELVDGWPTWLLDNVPSEALQGIVPKSADAYDKIEKVGQGTYSNVYKARERGTGRIVALKKVRFDTSESESVRFMAREMTILRRLDHPNVIRLDGIATSRMHRSIYLVFDLMYSDLTRLICRPDHRLTEPQIKCYMQQLLSGLQHCHERGILHRDIKGSNLLIDRDGVLKIGDFGLANYYGPNRRRPLTSRVVTLWYRAPELLLGSSDYGVGIDLWSAGCLLAEMFFAKALMPGRTEVEQLFKIFNLCGSPPDDYWRKMKLPASFRPPKTYKSTMLDKFRDLPPSSIGLLTTLLALDPAARGTAGQALQSNFFSTPPLPCDLSSLPVVYKEEVADPTTSHDGRKPKLRQRSQKRRDSKQKAEEQHADEPTLNSESPNKKEEKTMDDTAKSDQVSDGTAVNASSSVQEPENTIVNASSSTVSKRFSVSPVQVLPEGSPAPQDQQLRRTNTYHSSSDDHKNYQPLLSLDDQDDQKGRSIMNHGLEIRSASMSEYDATRHDQGDLSNNKQYVFVDHI